MGIIYKPAKQAPQPEFKLPGQKRATPPKTDPLYKFYTSLLKQRKNSEMALKWCLEHGVLSQKKAEKVMLLYEMKKLSLKSNKT